MTCPFFKKVETNLCLAYAQRPLVVSVEDRLKFCENENHVHCPTFKMRR